VDKGLPSHFLKNLALVTGKRFENDGIAFFFSGDIYLLFH